MSGENVLWKNLSHAQKVEYLARTSPDCCFHVGNSTSDAMMQIFNSHRWILSEDSPVFERMLNGDFKEAKPEQIISLSEDEPLVFRKFINYIYYGTFKETSCASAKCVISLYFMGKKYMVPALMAECLQFFKSEVTERMVGCQHVPNFDNFQDDAVCMFEFFYSINESMMFSYVSRTVQTQLENKKQSIFKNASIYFWNMSTFYKFIETVKHEPYVREIERYDMVALYAKINGLMIDDEAALEKKTVHEKSIKDITSNESVNEAAVNLKIMYLSIDYNQMTAKEFFNGPGKTNLFNWFEKYAIIGDIINT